jgi:hypothetical protein
MFLDSTAITKSSYDVGPLMTQRLEQKIVILAKQEDSVQRNRHPADIASAQG